MMFLLIKSHLMDAVLVYTFLFYLFIFSFKIYLCYAVTEVIILHGLWKLPPLDLLSTRFEIQFNQLSSANCTPVLGLSVFPFVSLSILSLMKTQKCPNLCLHNEKNGNQSM